MYVKHRDLFFMPFCFVCHCISPKLQKRSLSRFIWMVLPSFLRRPTWWWVKPMDQVSIKTPNSKSGQIGSAWEWYHLKPFKRTSTAMFLIFNFSTEYLKQLQSSEPLHAKLNPTSWLHRILSSYWLAHCYLMKKSTKVALYFGLDCGMMKFFTFKPQSKEQLMPLPHLWSMVWRKRSRFKHMQTVIRTSRWIRFNSAWSGSELWSL